MCEGVHDLQPRGGQAEKTVKSRQVLPDVGSRGWHLDGGNRQRRELQQHDGLPAAGDPAIKQRLDAVGGPELPWCVTRRPGGQAISRHGTRRAGQRRRRGAACFRAASRQQVLAGVNSLRRGAVGLARSGACSCRGCPMDWARGSPAGRGLACTARRQAPPGRSPALPNQSRRNVMHDVAPRGQHGDGRHHSQDSRAPQAPPAAGLVVHRGLLTRPGRDIVSFSCLSPREPLYRMGGDSAVTEYVTCLSPATCDLGKQAACSRAGRAAGRRCGFW